MKIGKILPTLNDIQMHLARSAMNGNSICIRFDYPDGYSADAYSGIRVRLNGGDWEDVAASTHVFSNLATQQRYIVEAEYHNGTVWIGFPHELVVNLVPTVDFRRTRSANVEQRRHVGGLKADPAHKNKAGVYTLKGD